MIIREVIGTSAILQSDIQVTLFAFSNANFNFLTCHVHCKLMPHRLFRQDKSPMALK